MKIKPPKNQKPKIKNQKSKKPRSEKIKTKLNYVKVKSPKLNPQIKSPN